MEKINSYVPTPFTLQCFCNRCIRLKTEEKRHIYKLYSVITHVGATMSVGHYVAYTCSLDILNEAGHCPNMRDKSAAVKAETAAEVNGRPATNGSTNGADKKRGGIRNFFGNRKASSSSDISKNLKGVNGIMNKVVTNGIEKLTLSSTGGSSSTLNQATGVGTLPCQSGKCCGIHVKNSKLLSNNGGGGGANGGVSHSFVSYVNGHLNGDAAAAVPVEHSPVQANGGSNGSEVDGSERTGAARNGFSHISQDYWYMCDDDKIKVLTQQQFEEYLSPNRKNMITPYLLFYARFDT